MHAAKKTDGLHSLSSHRSLSAVQMPEKQGIHLAQKAMLDPPTGAQPEHAISSMIHVCHLFGMYMTAT